MTDLYYPEFIQEPTVKEISFNGGAKKCIIVKLDRADYERCENVRMWSSEKLGPYGEGILNTDEKKNVAEKVGKLGEVAFGKVFHEPIDFEYRKHGDATDFILMGDKAVDIKTALTDYGCTCIQVMNEGGHSIPMKSDIYVGALLHGSNNVLLTGWNTKNELSEHPIVPARRGTHYNIEMPHSTSHFIEELLEIHKEHLTNQN